MWGYNGIPPWNCTMELEDAPQALTFPRLCLSRIIVITPRMSTMQVHLGMPFLQEYRMLYGDASLVPPKTWLGWDVCNLRSDA